MISYLWVFLISMVPIVELRGAIPLGFFTWNLELIPVFLLSCIGNLVPVPFVLFLVPKILEWMVSHHVFPKIATWLLERGERGAQKLKDGALKHDTKKRFGACLALYVFVAIPLPGTGAWTGSLAAACFGLPKKDAILSITLGVLTAGIIVSLIVSGVWATLTFLL